MISKTENRYVLNFSLVYKEFDEYITYLACLYIQISNYVLQYKNSLTSNEKLQYIKPNSPFKLIKRKTNPLAFVTGFRFVKN